ncbi:MAG: nucleotidyl transferase AbiEii/AbiGii toxin family protein [Patescibacteria group bacterium]|jgi:predicted nucleotidyltransferase component of viral defense system|nr:nucleotidyl transferase AbiEii/AbiGii toxin family protein [Patescibacteria group bacterium]
MLNLKQIEQYYPDNLRGFRKNMLREYLQYKILEIIFNSKITDKLSFLGGTALCAVYGNTRFSEDLDFDNFGLTEEDFTYLSHEIKKRMEDLGYQVEIRNVFKGAYRCYIRIPKILYDNNISELEGEKIMIQVDTAPHNFEYEPDKKILNKFDVFTQILVTPLDILLSQKIYAVLNRKRAKGRDFFDIIFLLQKTKPNYKYLAKKINIKNSKELKQKLAEYLSSIDLKDLAKDVEPFLFSPKDSNKVTMFREYIEQIDL